MTYIVTIGKASLRIILKNIYSLEVNRNKKIFFQFLLYYDRVSFTITILKLKST